MFLAVNLSYRGIVESRPVLLEEFGAYASRLASRQGFLKVSGCLSLRNGSHFVGLKAEASVVFMASFLTV